MQEISQQLVNIRVVDGPGVPNTAAGLFGQDFLSQDSLVLPLILVILAAALFVVFRARPHLRVRKTLLLIPSIIFAIGVVLPSITQAARVVLPSEPINITIDKSRDLAATDSTLVELNQKGTWHAVVSAQISSDLNGYLGNEIQVDLKASSETAYSAVNTAVQTVATVTNWEKPGQLGLDIQVAISDDLPVGEYSATIKYYGEFVNAATVYFDCSSRYNARAAVFGASLNPIVNLDEDQQVAEVTLPVGHDYTLPTPTELGLDCQDSGNYWSGGLPDGYGDWVLGYDGYDVGNTVLVYEGAPIAPPDYNYPEPTDQPWYEQCWLNWDEDLCRVYYDDIDEWYNDVFYVWLRQYNAWADAQRDYFFDLMAKGEFPPLVDGMVFRWEYYGDYN